MLNEKRRKASGSRSEASGVFCALDKMKVRFVPPFRARSKCDGISLSEDKRSSSCSRGSLVVESWGSGA